MIGWSVRLSQLLLILTVAATPLLAAETVQPKLLRVYSVAQRGYVMSEKVVKNAAEWKAQLTPDAYRVLREAGTEAAFSSPLDKNHAAGIYRCAGCGLDLFRSEDKYDSGTGWPSFSAPLDPLNVRLQEDNSFFSRRTEVLCARCDGHLGHVFNDGPPPTGQRYCMNGVALTFVARP